MRSALHSQESSPSIGELSANTAILRIFRANICFFDCFTRNICKYGKISTAMLNTHESLCFCVVAFSLPPSFHRLTALISSAILARRVSGNARLRCLCILYRNFAARRASETQLRCCFPLFWLFEDVFVLCNSIAGKEFDPLMQLRRGSFRPYLLSSDFS